MSFCTYKLNQMWIENIGKFCIVSFSCASLKYTVLSTTKLAFTPR